MKRILSLLFTLSIALVVSAQTAPAESSYDYANDQKEWVDLGLPSGTLWATCNVGATCPEEGGDHFAWGETSGYKNGKTEYTLETYKYKGESQCSKYNDEDAKQELDPSDDAAYVNWGCNWRIPSEAQLDELREECTWTRDMLNRVTGFRVTSKSNGASIFLPDTGVRGYKDIYYVGRGYYLSRTLYENDSYSAVHLYFRPDSVEWGTDSRSRGYAIRPVYVPTKKPSSARPKGKK